MSDQPPPNDPNQPPRGPDPFPPQGDGPYGNQPGGPYAGQPADPEQPRPWEQGGAWENQSGGPSYPRQHLLPQEIKPGRNRTPLFIAIGVVLVLVIVGSIGYLALRDNGEDNRDAYCSALRDLTDNGDITSAINDADKATADDIKAVMDLAPDSVAGDWKTIDKGITSIQSGSPDMGQALELFNALKGIASDAQKNCNLDLDIPFS
jgi:hypothetical protein